MSKRFRWLFAVMILLNGTIASAASVEEEIAMLKQRILQLEQKLEDKQEEIEVTQAMKQDLAEIKSVFGGLEIGVGGTYVLQGTQGTGDDVSDASYSIDVEFAKTFDDYGMAYLHLETGDGAGVEDELSLFSNVNRDADDSDNSVAVTEFWYEHYFKSLPVTFTFGKIDPTAYIDTNAYANDECTQFLGHTFRNSPTLTFPDDNSAGVRLLVEPAEFVDFELLAMDANDDWEDVFDNLFIAGQVNIKPNLCDRPGNYRAYVWLNDKEFVKWDDPVQNEEANYGFGISIDQEITDVVGVFARYGWQNPDVYAEGEEFSLEHAWSAGVEFSGSLWKRENDTFGVAVGQIFPSDEYKDAGDNLNADSEEHLELYYSFVLNEYLTITPDLQVIWDPYGNDIESGDDTVFVGGLRAQLYFYLN